MVNQIFQGQHGFGHVVGVIFASGGRDDDSRLRGVADLRRLRALGANPLRLARRRPAPIPQRTDVLPPPTITPHVPIPPISHVFPACSPVWSKHESSRRNHRPAARLSVGDRCDFAGEVALGDSIAVNGCCLTVVEQHGEMVAFEAGPETLKRTTSGHLVAGSHVNLERSLRMSDRLGGHFVTGHVDGLGSLDARDDDGTWSTFWFRARGT